MSGMHPSHPLARLQRLARRLVECTRGVAAIEFGMIVPVMFALFVGSVEISQAITVDRRVTQVASSTADLVSRQTTVSDTTLAGYMQIITELLRPYDSSSTALQLSILSVYIATTDTTASNPMVCWFYDYQGGTGSHTHNSTYTKLVGANVLTTGTSVIVAEVKYSYVGPIFRYFLPKNAPFPLSETFYLKPRLSTEVIKSDGANTKCLS